VYDVSGEPPLNELGQAIVTVAPLKTVVGAPGVLGFWAARTDTGAEYEERPKLLTDYTLNE
jgi:hypothetical protein